MPLDQKAFVDALVTATGSGGVITGAQDMRRYLTDWRGEYTGHAIAVARPGTTAEVSAIMRLAEESGYAIIPQGGNTGLCGGATPDQGERNLIVSTERLNRIRNINPAARTITVEAGCILEHIQAAAAEHGLLFPLDLGARGTCRIGGNLSTNAGGLNVIRYGNARDLTLGLEVVLAGGKVLNSLSGLRKDNTGYDLKHLFIGAEGTLGVITAATLRLFSAPVAKGTAFASLRDIDAGIELLHLCQSASGDRVTAFELMPKSIIDNVHRFYPEAATPLEPVSPFSVLIEIASTAMGDRVASSEGAMPLDRMLTGVLAEALASGLISDAVVASSGAQREALWNLRELTPESEIKAGRAYKSDISVPLEHLSAFYAEAAAQAGVIAPGVRVFGFGHLGDGNLHFNLAEPLEGDANFKRHYASFDAMLLGLLSRYGGSISAEHGIGQKKRELLGHFKDETTLSAMRAVKRALDPKGLMNPGKII